jgi:uncharacterized membrane-anchored protein YitT (DUF2179 family)
VDTAHWAGVALSLGAAAVAVCADAGNSPFYFRSAEGEQTMTKQTVRDYVYIMIGTFLLAYAVIAFWAPEDMVTGGLSGLAIIVEHYSELWLEFRVPIWFTNFVLNIPLFVIGYRAIPRVYFWRSLFAYLFLVFALWVCEFLPVPPVDLLLSAVFGGVVAGVGIGFVFRAMATTGGSTLAAKIIQRNFLRHVSVPMVLFGVDALIIVLGFFVFGPQATLYAIIAVFVGMKVTDAVIEGLHFAKAAYIISRQHSAIATAILHDLERGCTALDSRGMFTGESQPMLICVVSAKEITRLKEIVYGLDTRAFVFVADVREVLGEGFHQGSE